MVNGEGSKRRQAKALGKPIIGGLCKVRSTVATYHYHKQFIYQAVEVYTPGGNNQYSDRKGLVVCIPYSKDGVRVKAEAYEEVQFFVVEDLRWLKSDESEVVRLQFFIKNNL